MTPVIFRIFEGEVTAIFPYIPGSRGHCTCYAHIGQHGSCDYLMVMERSRQAQQKEYHDLLDELVNHIGYDDLAIYRVNENKTWNFQPSKQNDSSNL